MVYPRRAAGFFLKALLCVISRSRAQLATTIRDGSGHVRRLRQGAGGTRWGCTRRPNLSMCPVSRTRDMVVAYPPCQTGRKQRVSGGWEHGACLGPLQASQRQRHVENSALPGSLSSASRRVFRSAVPSDNNCFFPPLEGLEVKKIY